MEAHGEGSVAAHAYSPPGRRRYCGRTERLPSHLEEWLWAHLGMGIIIFFYIIIAENLLYIKQQQNSSRKTTAIAITWAFTVWSTKAATSKKETTFIKQKIDDVL